MALSKTRKQFSTRTRARSAVGTAMQDDQPSAKQVGQTTLGPDDDSESASIVRPFTLAGGDTTKGPRNPNQAWPASALPQSSPAQRSSMTPSGSGSPTERAAESEVTVESPAPAGNRHADSSDLDRVQFNPLPEGTVDDFYPPEPSSTREIFSLTPAAPTAPITEIRTSRIRNALAGVRMLALVTAAVAVASDASAGGTGQVIWLLILVGITMFRLIRPLSATDSRAVVAQLAIETMIVTAAIATTGLWSSVFVVFLLAPVVSAGLLTKPEIALIAAFVPPVIVFVMGLANDAETATVVRDSTTWVAVLALIAAAAGNLKRLADEGVGAVTGAGRRNHLEAANDLLTSLHQVAQRLPASLDIGEVLDSTAGRIRGLVAVDTIAILLDDGLPNQLSVAFSSGTSLGDQIDRSRLPVRAMERVEVGEATLDGNLLNGLSGRSRSAMYLPLAARNAPLGLIVVEHKEPDKYSMSQLRLLTDVAQNADLEVDNARWFARLRTVGADEERNRIARDLHDRIGQALAYLGFELDRLNAKTVTDEELRKGVARLRVDVRSVVQEVRDTLYDLRTEVTDQERLQNVLAKFCSRVAERSGLTIVLDADVNLNVSVRQERELWRIAQEALTNVERHARASQIEISWSRNGDLAILDITDDGQGFTPGRSGRSDSYGLLGMRERASAIGAVLTIEEARGRGTHIRCSLAIDDPRRVPDTTLSGGKG